MPLLASILFGFVPMFFFAFFMYWLDRYEKEPKALLTTVFIWGVIVAAGGAFFINTVLGMGVYVFTGSEAAAELTIGSLIAPVVEETLKGLAVLVVFFIFRREFDSILDGIIYAAIVALGFAAAENSYYIFAKGYQEDGWTGFWVVAFVRIILVGLQHPFYTAFIGIGLAVSRMSRKMAIILLAPVIGWCVSVSTHAFHNTLLTVIPGLGGMAARHNPGLDRVARHGGIRRVGAPARSCVLEETPHRRSRARDNHICTIPNCHLLAPADHGFGQCPLQPEVCLHRQVLPVMRRTGSQKGADAHRRR